MRLVRQPKINTERIEELRSSNALWLVELVAWIVGVLERYAPAIAKYLDLREAAARSKTSVARQLRDSVRELRLVVIGCAVARMRFVGRRRGQILRPGSTRAAALRARTNARFARRATAHVLRDMQRGSLRERTERLAAHFANLEPLIERTLTRLNAMHRAPRGVRSARVITHQTCASLAFAHTAALADTS